MQDWLMYESFFRFSHRPFAPAPQAEAYIPIGSLEQIRQTLVRCVDRGEGPGLVVGPAGSGKSLLCQVLAKHFRGRFLVAFLSSARLCTRRALLQNILFELKLPYRDMDEGELRLSLIDHLEPRFGGPDGLLLLVDEAHTLPLRLLEEIRLLTNLVRDGQSRVRLVLAGSMALEERLASPKLESFHQRIAARCYLPPFSREETIQYVQEQIRRAGSTEEGLFAPGALAAVHTATDGIPRLINQVCDHALLLAALDEMPQIDAARIEEAWADLQQLPVPLHEPKGAEGTFNWLAAPSGALPAVSAQTQTGEDLSLGGVIEFGQLDDPPPAAGAPPAAVAGTIKPSTADAAEARLACVSEQIDALRQDDSLDAISDPPPAASAPAAAEDHSAASATEEGPPTASGGYPASGAVDFSPVDDSGTEVELVFHSAHDPFGGHWEHEEVVIDRYASLQDAALRCRHQVQSEEGRRIGAAVSEALEALDERVENFNPADDPLLPDENLVTLPAPRAAVSLRDLAEDDRDMIVVEEEPVSPRPPPPARPKRPEYRQLFSSLRNK